MATGLVIPGVQVTVVKEVLPRQLAASGILGLVGFTERNPGKVVRAGSWARYVEALGRGSAYSLPEARQALDNGVSELVLSPLPEGAGALARVAFKADQARAQAARVQQTPGDTQAGEKEARAVSSGEGVPSASGLTLVARVPGPWANGIHVEIKYRSNIDKSVSFDLHVHHPASGTQESFRQLTPSTVTKALEDGSAFVKVDATVERGWPVEGVDKLSGGTDASPEHYAAALERLRNEPDVDLVLAAIQDFDDRARVSSIYAQVISHCELLSAECKGRIGFGQVPPQGSTEAQVQLASNLTHERFVLVAPHGVVGAVAGRVGSLPYFASPTFKQVSGLGEPRMLGVEEQKALLTKGVVPVVPERGRGTLILRGLTTDGDQINVRRVADRAVRTLKMIGDLFIGLLNTADGRGALKQKLIESLVQMERDGALVPSTDGKQPAFTVEVHSSQDDFALGIVRVNMAVRPVRAIDYVYATITVQV